MRIEFKTSEVVVLLAAAVMSLLANLPDSVTGNIVDKKILLAGLAALIVVAMFRYLQVFLLILISVLAIGANLPADMADAFGISKLAMLISLGTLIAMTLLNRVLGLLPTISRAPATGYTDKRAEMLAAISRGDQVTLHRILVMNVSPNFILDGISPLHLAAEKGYPEIVRLLISYGADYRQKNDAGKTALEIALSKKKFVQTTDVIYNAVQSGSSPYNHAGSRRGDGEISPVYRNYYVDDRP